jgi:hypothetical protein
VREEDPSEVVVEEVLGRIGAEPERESLARFPRGVGWVYATVQLENEVFNGGFHQYFWNTAGALIDLAIAGYEAFECPQHADVARRASRVASRELNRSKTRDHETVRHWLSAFQESEKQSSLERLDKEWYGLDQIEQISIRRNDAIRQKPKLYAMSSRPN